MPVPAHEATLDRDLLRDRAYVALRDAIVDGTLAPGERLRDVELTRWLGLSRTPVREALARLEQDGLVETAPQRFTRVAPLDRRAARDAFPLVAALHALAAELAVPRLTASDFADMLDANERFAGAIRNNRVELALGADDDFHGVFVLASANAELPRALSRLMPGVRRLERLRFGSLPGRASVRQHAEIVRLATAGDAAATAAAVRDNWLSLGALIDRTFADADTPESAETARAGGDNARLGGEHSAQAGGDNARVGGEHRARAGGDNARVGGEHSARAGGDNTARAGGDDDSRAGGA